MMEVTFKPNSFDRFRGVEDVLKGVFGQHTYVGTNSMCVHVEYSPKLVAMIRPFPPQQVFNFELKILKCEDCMAQLPFLAAEDENSFVCEPCVRKRDEKKKKQK